MSNICQHYQNYIIELKAARAADAACDAYTAYVDAARDAARDAYAAYKVELKKQGEKQDDLALSTNEAHRT